METRSSDMNYFLDANNVSQRLESCSVRNMAPKFSECLTILWPIGCICVVSRYNYSMVYYLLVFSHSFNFSVTLFTMTIQHCLSCIEAAPAITYMNELTMLAYNLWMSCLR